MDLWMKVAIRVKSLESWIRLGLSVCACLASELVQTVDISFLFDIELEPMDELVDGSGKMCQEVTLNFADGLSQDLGKGHNWH